jgi:hypothetical protein
MADYYAVLVRKIRETSDDPAKMREVVYEAARLALRWQVQGQWPRLSTIQAKCEVRELEEAIARLEAEASRPGGLGKPEPGNAKAGLKASRQSHRLSAAPDAVEEFEAHLRHPASNELENGAMAGNPDGLDNYEPDEAPAVSNTGQRSHTAPIGTKDSQAPSRIEDLNPRPISAALAGLEAVARSLDSCDDREPDDAAAAIEVGQQSRDSRVAEVENVPGAFKGADEQSRAPPSVELPGSGATVSRGGRENREPSQVVAPLAASLQNHKNRLPGTAEKPHLQRRDLPPTAEESVGPDGRRDPKPAKALAGLSVSRKSPPVPIKLDDDDGPDTVREPDLQRGSLPSAGLADVNTAAAADLEPRKNLAGFRASRPSRYLPIESEEADASHRRPPLPAELAGSEAAVSPRRRSNTETMAGPAASLENNVDDSLYRIDVPHVPRRDFPPAEVAEVEADPAWPAQRDEGARGETLGGFKRSQPMRYVPIESKEDAAADTSEKQNPPRADFHELVLVPDRTRRSTYVVKPDDLVRRDATYSVKPAPHLEARFRVSGLVVGSQVVIAAVAIAALWVSLWGRSSPVQTAIEMTPAAQPASPAASPSGTGMVAAASLAAPPVAEALPFSRPTTYGVYAVRGDQLVELEQVQGTPIDPRNRSQLQIVTPVQTVIDPAKPAFVVFRRDLVSSAPEKVPVRIASRIAHSMIFDASGKPVVTTPETATWLIRDKGYDLRVSPLRESLEMVMLHPENLEFSFPPGRYELMLGGQAYDFVVAGEVIDPAHCVEGVATVRGPVFYECKPAQ